MARRLAAPSAVLFLLATSATGASAATHARRFLSPVAARAHARTHRHGARARAAVVGGTLMNIEQAPWQVEISGNGALECGGAIVGESRVVTEAVCVTEVAGRAIPAANLHVIAGSSNILTENEEEKGDNTVQTRKVAKIRVHPFYRPAPPESEFVAPDDVAVLELETPLTETAAVRKIALPAGPANPVEGTAATFTGFGEGNAVGGGLYSTAMRTGFPRLCGGVADAVTLCASTEPGDGVPCLGDFGGPLAQAGSSPALVGLLVAIEVGCPAASTDAFANLSAPEIADFINGSESPPRAPRGPEPKTASISGFIEPGHLLTCNHGVWTNSPKFSYAFIDSAGRRVLQSGESPAYPLTEADVGREISCEIQATNAGGTGVQRTLALPPIKGLPAPAAAPAAPGPAAPAGGSIGVLATTEASASRTQIEAALKAVLTPKGRAARVATLRRTHSFTVAFPAPEAGTVVIDWFEVPHGAHVARRQPILIAAGRAVSGAAGRVKVTIKLTAAGRALLRRGHAVKLTSKATFTPSGGGGGAVSARTTFTLGR